MGWRKRRTLDHREEEHLGTRVPEPASPAAAPFAGLAEFDLLRDPQRPGLANAGRYAALLQAGQQALGNRAMQGLLCPHGLQAKFVVSQPGDACEQEADRVAAAVVGGAAAAVQRQPSVPEGGITSALTALSGAPQVTPQVEAGIDRLRGGGRPLPDSVREFFEPRFGADLRPVRLHIGDQAADVAQEVRARAFTVGSDVVFGSGQYAPDTAAGRSLLAHELTHVVQQGAAGGSGATGRVGQRVLRAPADGPPKGPEAAAATLKEQEALTKALIAALQGKRPEEKDQGTEAVKKTIEAFLETAPGKKLKKQALGFAFSSKGLPFTLLVGSAALAAMVANNTSIPSVPDIPLSKDVSLQVAFKGTLQNMTGMTVGLKFTFGGASERAEKPATQVAELPPWSPGQKIPAELLRKWLRGVAFQEYELAGPDEEEDRRKFHLKLEEDPEIIPDARMLAEALGREILSKSAQGEKRVEFDLKYEDLWKEAYRLFERSKIFRPGLVARLRFLVDAVVAELPESARGVEQVTFACAGRLFPLRVVKERGK